jgi:hypothetical protein
VFVIENQPAFAIALNKRIAMIIICFILVRIDFILTVSKCKFFNYHNVIRVFVVITPEPDITRAAMK